MQNREREIYLPNKKSVSLEANQYLTTVNEQKQRNKTKNVIPILFTIENAKITIQNSNRDHSNTNTHINTQQTNKDMLLEKILNTKPHKKTTQKKQICRFDQDRIEQQV